jgi:hypothetical protein
MRDTRLNVIICISSVQRRTFLCITSRGALMFRTFCNTDVSAPLVDRNYNRRYTDLSLSGRLYHRVLKHVLLNPSIPSSPALIIVGESFCSSLDAGFLKSDGKVSKTKRNDSAPISLEVVSPATAVHKKDLLTTAEAQTEERTLGQQPYTKIGRPGLGMTLSIATLV